MNDDFAGVAEELQSLVRAVYARVSKESKCFDGRREHSGSQDTRENVECESSVVETSCMEIGVEDSGRVNRMRAYRRYVDSKFRSIGSERGDAAFGMDKGEILLGLAGRRPSEPLMARQRRGCICSRAEMARSN